MIGIHDIPNQYNHEVCNNKVAVHQVNYFVTFK